MCQNLDECPHNNNSYNTSVVLNKNPSTVIALLTIHVITIYWLITFPSKSREKGETMPTVY